MLEFERDSIQTQDRQKTKFYKVSVDEIYAILEEEALLSSAALQMIQDGRPLTLTTNSSPRVRYDFIPTRGEDKFFMQISCLISLRKIDEVFPEMVLTILKNRSPLTFYHCIRN